MFKKILIANRGENDRAAGVSAQPNCMVRAARASAQPNRMVRAAHAGEFPAMETCHV